jgi:hypothetical protein
MLVCQRGLHFFSLVFAFISSPISEIYFVSFQYLLTLIFISAVLVVFFDSVTTLPSLKRDCLASRDYSKEVLNQHTSAVKQRRLC